MSWAKIELNNAENNKTESKCFTKNIDLDWFQVKLKEIKRNLGKKGFEIIKNRMLIKSRLPKFFYLTHKEYFYTL